MKMLQIMNRLQVEALSEKGFKPHTLLISVNDYGASGVNLKHFPEFFIRTEFNDMDGDMYLDAYGKPLSARDEKSAEAKYHPLNSEQSKKIARVYLQVKDRAEIVICQCEHGESRSAAIAAAIAEFESKEGLRYFIDDKYCPNKFVFRKIYNSLRKESVNPFGQKYHSFVAVDIETTGLGENAEIIEIGAIKCEYGETTDRFQTFVTCISPIPEAVTSLTGISDNDLTGAPDVKTALKNLKKFVGDMPLIGYNIGFDMAFIKRYGADNGIAFDNRTIDVLTLVRQKLQGKDILPNYKLSTVTKHLKIDFVPHRAVNDAEATVAIYKRLQDNKK